MTQGIDASAVASSIPAPASEAPAPAPAADASEASNPQTPVEGQQDAEVKQPSQKLEDDPDYVRRFNALARQGRELRQKEEEIKAKYGEYEAYQKERAKLKENPLEFLESNGWKFQDLADFVLNDNKPSTETQVSKLQKRLDELEAERKAEIEAKALREKQKKEHETITAFKTNIKETVSSNSEQYELINHFGEYDTVYDVIQNYYNQNGEILDVNKAAAEVEKYLEQQVDKASSTQKFRKKYSPIEQAMRDAAEKGQESKPQDSGLQTLTNDAVSAPSAAQTSAEHTYLSEEESKKKSAEILREWILKRQGYTKN